MTYKRFAQWQLAAVLAVVGILGPVPVVSAQTQTGNIVGKVIDASDAVLPGVTITLEAPVLLQPIVAQTSETGSYQFPRLPVGIYRLKFELAGFRTLVREGIHVDLGFNVQINVKLEPSGVSETVTVSGASPVVDMRDTKTGGTFTIDALQNIPSARDPWVILQQTTGVAVDRENIGGNQSGQQSGYVARGSTSNTNWNLDGMVVTSAVTGATPMYFDFDMFEEVQIQTGGVDAAEQTGGVGVHIVTKSGTDRFKGSTRYYWVGSSLQSDNVDDALRAQGAGSGNPVQSVSDYGVEAGGPVVKGHAWVWGSYGKQDIKVGILGFFKPGTTELETDQTLLKTYNIKGQAQAFKGNRVTWYTFYNNKIRNHRDASDLRPPETTYQQVSPIWTHKFSDQHVFNDHLLIDLQIAHIGGLLLLNFQQPDLAAVQPTFELVSPAGLWGRSFNENIAHRPQTNVDFTLNYFLPSVAGGDHALKAGFRFRNTPADSHTHIGGFAIARFRSGVASEAELDRDSNTDYGLKTVSGYAQDTFTRARLTLNIGGRVDWQADEALESSVPANPIVPDLLPAVSFAGAKSDVVWLAFSPRLGMTYDIRGNSKTVAKASYAQYYGQSFPGATSSILNPVTAASITVPWKDLNGDAFIQANEIDTTRILSFTGNYDPANPTFLGTKNSLDPNYQSDRTKEFIVGVDHELMPDFAVGASWIWRNYDRFSWDQVVGLSSSDYVPVLFTATGCAGGCPTVTYYQPSIPIPGVRMRTNVPDRRRSYSGFDFSARKRFSRQWMLNASLSLNDARDHWNSPNAYQDPTNIDKLNNAQFAPVSSGSGIGNVYTNSRWLFKLSGMHSLRYGINVSGFYNARQGYPFPQSILTPSRANRAGTIQVLIVPLGDNRLDTFQNLDFRVEKVVNLYRTARANLSFDVFNVFNGNTALSIQPQLNSTNANKVSGIVPPRIARLGVRLTW